MINTSEKAIEPREVSITRSIASIDVANANPLRQRVHQPT